MAYKVDTIFPTKSPVAFGQKKRPLRLSTMAAKFGLKTVHDRISELMHARKDVNKVHSEGYFENHYPEADGELKGLLHEKVMLAHSRLNNPNPDKEDNSAMTNSKNESRDFLIDKMLASNSFEGPKPEERKSKITITLDS